MLNTAKKNFLKSLAPGVSTLLVCSCAVDDIFHAPDCPEEDLIKQRLIKIEQSMAGHMRPWLSEKLFRNFVDEASDTDILRIMTYLEERDFGLRTIYLESCTSNDDPYDDNSFRCGRLVSSGIISSVQDLVDTNLI
tara:strand:- start:1070 stop:1477 length:408 start_codon:yes stop_codon:yes gene_type:complete